MFINVTNLSAVPAGSAVAGPAGVHSIVRVKGPRNDPSGTMTGCDPAPSLCGVSDIKLPDERAFILLKPGADSNTLSMFSTSCALIALR